jgi:hypothetical protein
VPYSLSVFVVAFVAKLEIGGTIADEKKILSSGIKAPAKDFFL